jgi:hypothetical protein
VLPDELEKHCIQAERNLDKNGSASKKLASAHLPLWICRRFSTDALVLQVLELPNLSVCIQVGCSVGSFSKQQSRIVGRTSIVGKTPAFFLPPISAVPLSSCRQKNACAVLAWYRPDSAFAPSVFHAEPFLCIS